MAHRHPLSLLPQGRLRGRTDRRHREPAGVRVEHQFKTAGLTAISVAEAGFRFDVPMRDRSVAGWTAPRHMTVHSYHSRCLFAQMASRHAGVARTRNQAIDVRACSKPGASARGWRIAVDSEMTNQAGRSRGRPMQPQSPEPPAAPTRGICKCLATTAGRTRARRHPPPATAFRRCTRALRWQRPSTGAGARLPARLSARWCATYRGVVAANESGVQIVSAAAGQRRP